MPTPTTISASAPSGRARLGAARSTQALKARREHNVVLDTVLDRDASVAAWAARQHAQQPVDAAGPPLGVGEPAAEILDLDRRAVGGGQSVGDAERRALAFVRGSGR